MLDLALVLLVFVLTAPLRPDGGSHSVLGLVLGLGSLPNQSQGFRMLGTDGAVVANL